MASAPGFQIELEPGDQRGAIVVKASGELDSGSSELLLEAIRSANADHEHVQLDLHAISFIDSAGMRAMIMIEQASQETGTQLEVIPPPDDVFALLRAAGIAERIKLTPAAPGEWSDNFSERIELEFPRDPSSPARARAEVREALAGKLADEELGQVVLLTSELMTNAVVHPQGPDATTVGLRVTTYDRCVRVEVEDSGEGFDPSVPIAAAPMASASEGGRGLYLVDTCSARWGAERVKTDRGPRFRVWFEFEWDEHERAA